MAKPFCECGHWYYNGKHRVIFLVDDSCLCKNPKDGITYKILLNDIRISRYVQKNYVRVGDTVEILFRDQIDKENDHTISEAMSVSKVTIIDGKAYIFE